MITITQQSDSNIAIAFMSMQLNIRQISDEESGIDAKIFANMKLLVMH